MQQVVSDNMQEMEINVKSQLQKILNLDTNLLHEAKSIQMCPLDMTPEKWKLELKDLERELLKDIKENDMKIKSELENTEYILADEAWRQTVETMRKEHVSEKRRLKKSMRNLNCWKNLYGWRCIEVFRKHNRNLSMMTILGLIQHKKKLRIIILLRWTRCLRDRKKLKNQWMF